MHIADGVLSFPVLAGGTLAAAAGTAYGLKHLTPERMVPTALFSSAFFVASLIHVPIPPSSAHLLMLGLTGLALGSATFPAVLVSLLLQAFLFQLGGITVLGVNTWIMAAPAVLCALPARALLGSPHAAVRSAAAFGCGFFSVIFAALLAAGGLYLSGDNFQGTALSLLTAHLPIALIEGGICLTAVNFLLRVRPEFLNIRREGG